MVARVFYRSERPPCLQNQNIDFKYCIQITKWNRNLPQVQPFYAVKCNPDPNVLKVHSSDPV